jgi:cyclophilin family peptidyl-prolyl cis-trans isomerase
VFHKRRPASRWASRLANRTRVFQYEEKSVKRFGSLVIAVGLFAVSACGGGPKPVVVMETSLGTIKIELYESRAPITVKNFLQYVDDRFYDGTVFHRVIPTFMIQGGGFNPDLVEKKTLPPIKNESYNGLTNEPGTLAMARTGEPDSATAQFFINVMDNDFLNRARAQDRVGYAVFGKVIEGMEVVNQIKEVPTKTTLAIVPGAGKMPLENVPVEPVIIKSVRRVETK